MKAQYKEYLEFKASQNIRNLFKDTIRMLEDFRDEGIIDEDEFQRHRKRVLDRGNDAIRNLSKELEMFVFDEYNKE